MVGGRQPAFWRSGHRGAWCRPAVTGRQPETLLALQLGSSGDHAALPRVLDWAILQLAPTPRGEMLSQHLG